MVPSMFKGIYNMISKAGIFAIEGQTPVVFRWQGGIDLPGVQFLLIFLPSPLNN